MRTSQPHSLNNRQVFSIIAFLFIFVFMLIRTGIDIVLAENPLMTKTSRSLCEGYASEVIEYSPGTKRNGGPVEEGHSHPESSLYRPEDDDSNNYVSLGFGGFLILKMDTRPILIKDGFEMRIFETSHKNYEENITPEKVEVFISSDNNTWQSYGPGYQDISISSQGFAADEIYVKLVDISDPEKFPMGEDGYDVDGVYIGANCRPTPTAVLHPSPSNTIAPIASKTFTLTPSKTIIPTPSKSVTSALSKTIIPTPSKSIIPSPSETVVTTHSNSITPTPSETAIRSSSKSATQAPSETVIPSSSKSATQAPSETAIPSSSKSATQAPSETVIPILTNSVIPAPSEAIIPTYFETITPTLSVTKTFNLQTTQKTPDPNNSGNFGVLDLIKILIGGIVAFLTVGAIAIGIFSLDLYKIPLPKYSQFMVKENDNYLKWFIFKHCIAPFFLWVLERHEKELHKNYNKFSDNFKEIESLRRKEKNGVLTKLEQKKYQKYLALDKKITKLMDESPDINERIDIINKITSTKQEKNINDLQNT